MHYAGRPSRHTRGIAAGASTSLNLASLRGGDELQLPAGGTVQFALAEPPAAKNGQSLPPRDQGSGEVALAASRMARISLCPGKIAISLTKSKYDGTTIGGLRDFWRCPVGVARPPPPNDEARAAVFA